MIEPPKAETKAKEPDEKTPEAELEKAWQSEGIRNFNRCVKCGRWVNTVMFNPDVLMCVDCAPIETAPNFCPHCGARVKENTDKCELCGKKLIYEGEKCGAPASTHRLFCKECGAFLTRKSLYDKYKARHKVCRKCKTILTDAAEYCPQCGAKQNNKER